MMNITTSTRWIAFARSKCIATGSPREVASAVKHYVDSHPAQSVLLFDAVTSQPVEIDLRGSLAAVLKRLPTPIAPVLESETPQPASGGRGRPKLGVVAREVTLLPRHWEWLATQPGGASVALRKLVEQARKAGADADRIRQAREAAYRFMSAMAGNEADYEEATRALFAGETERLRACMASWPRDIQKHTLLLVEAAQGSAEPATASH